VLDLRDKRIRQISLPLEDVYMLEADCPLTAEKIKEISMKGHSRIPIFSTDRSNLIGMLLAKKLIGYNPNDKIMTAREFPMSPLPFVKGDTSCYDVLNLFQEGRSKANFNVKLLNFSLITS